LKCRDFKAYPLNHDTNYLNRQRADLTNHDCAGNHLDKARTVGGHFTTELIEN